VIFCERSAHSSQLFLLRFLLAAHNTFVHE
jgi:hypothetical protein